MPSWQEHVFGKHGVRPDTPDFWRLSELVLKYDGRMQEAASEEDKQRVWAESWQDVADQDSVAYMAIQRAMRLMGVETRMDLVAVGSEVSRLAACYMEAFLMGVQFERARK